MVDRVGGDQAVQVDVRIAQLTWVRAILGSVS